jgi:uncharacterized protein (DUF1778 family)
MLQPLSRQRQDTTLSAMRRTDPISFRIKAEIKQALERLAKADRRSLSQYIELALEAHIEAAERKQQRKAPRS